MKKCELCNSVARMYCDSDQASLCWDCDARVHMANFLVAKHWRTLLCHVCQSPTPWTASGPRLAPVVSFCPLCDNSNSTTSAVTDDHHSENDRGDDEDDEADQSDRDDNDNDNDDDDDDDGDNQVVPLASTPVQPVASTSSSREESSKRFSQGRFDSTSASTSASRVAVLSNRADQNSSRSLCDRTERSQKKQDYKIR